MGDQIWYVWAVGIVVMLGALALAVWIIRRAAKDAPISRRYNEMRDATWRRRRRPR